MLNVVVDGKGTWVVNKQPPNRQIWVSSPVSGPRRFDWVEWEVAEERDGTGRRVGRWVCLREGEEKGVGLGELLRRELGEGVSVGDDEGDLDGVGGGEGGGA